MKILFSNHIYLNQQPWITKIKKVFRGSHDREKVSVFMCGIINDTMYQRPKSCSKRSSSLKRPPERSYSLQNLSNVRYKERKPIVKLAWGDGISVDRSDQSEMNATTTFKNCNSIGCDDFQTDRKNFKSSLDEPQRKLIDIRVILARSLPKSGRVFSSKQVCASSNTKMKTFQMQDEPFGENNELNCISSNDFSGNEIMPLEDKNFSNRELDIEIDTIENENRGQESYRNEKKVTFANEVFEKKKLDAETRRLNFRNSHAKWNKNGSLVRKENQNSFNCALSQGTFEFAHQFPKRVDSVTLTENMEQELENVNFESANQLKPLSQVDKAKSLSVKRKLKSCRSRSFHRSLDNSSVIQMVDTYTFVKSLKPNQTEVVTMVSLLTSNEEQDSQPCAASPIIVSDVGFESKCSIPTNADNDNQMKETVLSESNQIQIKSGILKTKPFSNRNTQILNKSGQQLTFNTTSRSLEPSTINESEISSTITINTCQKLVKNQTQFFSSLPNYESEKTEKNVEVNHPMIETLQSQKEKECWSSFRKMTNKGLLVSFDTILRGLLTPTEYRLRKHKLLGEE